MGGFLGGSGGPPRFTLTLTPCDSLRTADILHHNGKPHSSERVWRNVVDTRSPQVCRENLTLDLQNFSASDSQNWNPSVSSLHGGLRNGFRVP